MKKFIQRAAFALGALVAATGASADPVLTYNGHYYYYTSGPSSWTASEAEAAGRGAHLVTINDAAEQAALLGAFGNSERLWIGLVDVAGNNNWTWVSGEAATYTNWNAPVEPNNIGSERWSVMNWANNGKWNNLPDPGCCTNPLTPLRGIIEVDRPLPEPGSLALAAIALLGTAAAARRRRA